MHTHMHTRLWDADPLVDPPAGPPPTTQTTSELAATRGNRRPRFSHPGPGATHLRGIPLKVRIPSAGSPGLPRARIGWTRRRRVVLWPQNPVGCPTPSPRRALEGDGPFLGDHGRPFARVQPVRHDSLPAGPGGPSHTLPAKAGAGGSPRGARGASLGVKTLFV